MTKSPNRILTEEEFIATVDVMLAEGRPEAARALMLDQLEARPSAERPYAMTLHLKQAQRVAGQKTSPSPRGALNALWRRLRLAEYHAKVTRPGFKGLKVLIEGDSWVDGAPGGADLFTHVASQPGCAALSLAEPRDSAREMDHIGDYRRVIRRERPDVMILSLGGNDLLGEGRLASVLKRHRPGAGAGELIDWPALEARIAKVIAQYRGIIRGALALSPDLLILGQGYDDPRPVKGGRWLGKPLADKGISATQGHDVLARIIARYNEALRALAAETGGRFRHLNLHGTVGTAAQSWQDELHPKRGGFDRAAAPILAVLEALLAARQGTVDRPAPAPMLEEVTGASLTALMRARNLARPGGEGETPAVLRSDWPAGEEKALAEAWEDMEYLLDTLDAEDTPTRQRIRAELSPAPTHEMDARILGDASLDEANVLLRGARAARAVGKVMIRLPDGRTGSGTGFLVGPGLMLTNHHVLPDAHVAAESELVMEYQMDVDGIPQAPARFRITDDLYVSDEALDYAFVSVAAESLTGAALAPYGQLPLLAPSGKALKQERVSLIQHPRGVYKKLALRDSFVLGATREFLYYTSDGQRGGSGAPVFNSDWQVAALHHRAVPGKGVEGGLIANRGVRVSAILRQVAARAAAGELAARRLEDLLARGRAAGLISDTAEGDVVAMGSGHGGSGQPGLVLDGIAPSMPTPMLPQSRPGPDTVLTSGPFAGLALAQAQAALAHRWQATPGSGVEGDGAVVPQEAGFAFSPSAARAKLSERGYWQLVDHQSGGRDHYERVTRAAPVWPGGLAGVTIGFGYDLGWADRAMFHADWGAILTTAQLARLEAALGARGAVAGDLAEGLGDIRISFDQAKRVFDARMLPGIVAATWAALPTDALEALGADGVSALISLTFSRGPTWARPGDRYREMRAIRAALAEGRLADVPYQIRAMKRLDQGAAQPGLARRRDDEAKLLRDALALPVEAMATILPQTMLLEGVAEELDEEDDGPVGFDLSDPADPPQIALDIDLAEDGILAVRTKGRGGPRVSLVHGVVDPDLRHLTEELVTEPFHLTAEVVHGLIRAGNYAPETKEHGKLLLALRGCQMLGPVEKMEHQSRIHLRPTLPGQEDQRCLIGVMDMASGLISLYRGSTLSRIKLPCVRRGLARGDFEPDPLPTGCYAYELAPAGDGREVVLRNGFSTLGNPGMGVLDRQAFDAWADFQKAAGLEGKVMPARYDLLLVTGHEAAAVAAGRDVPCLRHGSQGDGVRHLQAFLGLREDGSFGPVTRAALTARQTETLGYATGVWSPGMARNLGTSFQP